MKKKYGGKRWQTKQTKKRIAKTCDIANWLTQPTKLKKKHSSAATVTIENQFSNYCSYTSTHTLTFIVVECYKKRGMTLHFEPRK